MGSFSEASAARLQRVPYVVEGPCAATIVLMMVKSGLSHVVRHETRMPLRETIEVLLLSEPGGFEIDFAPFVEMDPRS